MNRIPTCLILALCWVMPAHGALPSNVADEEDASELSLAERHNNLGTQHATRGDFRQAAGAFRKAIELDPTMTVAHFNLGLALARVDNHADAAFAFQSALRLSPRYFDGWFQLGLSLMALEKFAEAATAFEECMALRPRDASARFRLGQTYWKAGKWHGVIAQWDSLLTESPGHPSTEIVRRELPAAIYNIGLHHQDAGELDKAREAYEDVLRRDASYVPAMNNLAILLRAQGEQERAVELFEAITRLEPNHTGALLGAGGTLLGLNRPEEARQRYLKLREIKPEEERVYRGLAIAHMQMGDAETALSWVDEAEKRSDPFRALILKAFVLEHNDRGDRYGDGYDLDRVISVYREAIERFPDQALAYYNLGIVYARSSRWAEAIVEFERTLEVDPDYTQAKTALQEIDKITAQQEARPTRVK